VDAAPLTLQHQGSDAVLFSFTSKHRCLSEHNWNDSHTTTHLVMAFGKQVRVYASKVTRGNRVKVTGYLAYQDLDSASKKTPLIIAQKIVFI
jgi:single-stranded DNA-binding protein